MKKIFLSLLILVMSMILFSPNVHAEGDPGFTVYAFDGTETTHDITYNEGDYARIFVDGNIVYDGFITYNQGGINGLYMIGFNSSFGFQVLYDGDDLVSITSSNITFESEVTMYVIISESPDDYRAWSYNSLSAEHEIDTLDLNRTLFYISNSLIYDKGVTLDSDYTIIDSRLTSNNVVIESSIDEIQISYDFSDGSMSNEISTTLVVEVAEQTPAEMADFLDYITYPNSDEIAADGNDLITAAVWENPLFTNRLYFVLNHPELYVGDGVFDFSYTSSRWLNFLDLAGVVIPAYDEDDYTFTITQSITLSFYSDDGDTELTDYFSHLKIVTDPDGTSLNTYSIPLQDNNYRIDFTIEWEVLSSGDPTYMNAYFQVFDNLGDPITTQQSADDPMVMYFENPLDDTVPDIDGQAYYSTTYDAVISEASIRANLSVWDAVDGDITDQIILVSDEYTPNNDTIGSWDITYSVTDSSDNTSTFVVTVVVFDNAAPVITGGLSSYSVSYTQTFNTTNMLIEHTATDDHDGAVPVTIKTNTYTANKTVPGTYQIVLTASDSSDNETTKTITIYVVDDIAPTITAPSTITKDATTSLTLQQILAQVSAADAINGNVTSNIQVVTNEYAGKSMSIGSWNIIVRAFDESGNHTSKTITIDVVDELPGVWYVVDGFFLKVSPTVQLTIENIVETLVIAEELTPAEANTVSVIADNYSSNYSTVGNYNVTLGYVKQGVPQTMIVTMGITANAEGTVDEFTVVFITNGGSYIASQIIEDGSHVTRPSDPVRSGYTFSGWFEDTGFTQPWSFSSNTITEDTNIYAKWTIDSTAAGTPEWVQFVQDYWIVGIIIILFGFAVFGKRRKW